MLYESYDPFSFMMVLLFVYLILIGFIFILIYNNKYGSRKELIAALQGKSISGIPITTCSNCIPSPTPIIGQS
jgi:hypothetical protein